VTDVGEALTNSAARFWEAVAERRFLLERCSSCETWIWYPRGFCPECGSSDTFWYESSGRGEIYTLTVVRRSWGPWESLVPYVLAYVRLDEGPCILSNVIECDVDSVRVGQQVELCFVPSAIEPETTVFAFRPAIQP
jgi:uncharacterized protein